jgi:hypothetical protein
MSEEQRNEETEVEAHGVGPKTDHPQKFWANDEPSEDDEVEAHGGTIGKTSYPKNS